jgi:hypothetical protein
MAIKKDKTYDTLFSVKWTDHKSSLQVFWHTPNVQAKILFPRPANFNINHRHIPNVPDLQISISTTQLGGT